MVDQLAAILPSSSAAQRLAAQLKYGFGPEKLDVVVSALLDGEFASIPEPVAGLEVVVAGERTSTSKPVSVSRPSEEEARNFGCLGRRVLPFEGTWAALPLDVWEQIIGLLSCNCPDHSRSSSWEACGRSSCQALVMLGGTCAGVRAAVSDCRHAVFRMWDTAFGTEGADRLERVAVDAFAGDLVAVTAAALAIRQYRKNPRSARRRTLHDTPRILTVDKGQIPKDFAKLRRLLQSLGVEHEVKLVSIRGGGGAELSVERVDVLFSDPLSPVAIQGLQNVMRFVNTFYGRASPLL